MHLFAIRHAEAVPREPGAPDERRALTPEGKRRFARAVRGLADLEIGIDRLLHSPWRRAVETAELLAPIVRGDTVETALLARSPTARLLARLEGEHVGVVGHQPWLGDLVALLVTGETDAGARLALGKGALVWLEGEPRPGAMVLRALLPPRVLRRLGRRSR